ncbi:cytochrome P450 78A7-like [Hibiscus syriacus]|uniref:RNA-directed DNA polymerase n=1 Tax=Hibiscus syriacus TaxID=106335 RepID=A0A6A2ZHS1_HIBSY|nr:cytochrome P450 78A7-like [Hibiscus syriacus]
MVGNSNDSTVAEERGREVAPTNKNKKRDQSKAHESAFLEPMVAEFGKRLERVQYDFKTLEDYVLEQVDILKGNAEETNNEVEARFIRLEDMIQAVRESIEGMREDLTLYKRAIVSGGANNVPTPRVECPKPQGFNGARDAKEVENYLWRMEQYFEGIGLNDEAAKNVVYEARKKLRELKQRGIMRDYVKEFTTLMLQIPNMSEEDLLFYFIDRLQGWAKQEMHRRDIRMVDEAIAKSLVDFQPYSHTNTAKNKDKDYEEKKKAFVPKGGCFLYKGPHPMSSCPKLGSLSAIVDRQDTESQAEMGSLQVLNALKAKSLTPTPSNRLMYVEAVINEKPTRAIVDTGATHNFVSKDEANRLGLKSPCMIPTVEAPKEQGRDATQLSAIQLGKGIKKEDITYLAMLKEDDEIEKTDDLPLIIRDVLEENKYVMPPELPNKLPPRREVDHKIELGRAKVYTKMDLQKGYYQVRITQGDEPKTACITRYGSYEWLVMPFGLTNAPATFCTLMNKLFQPYLDQFMVVYLDDIVVYSNSIREHVDHLKIVFKILRENELYVKKEKCTFATEEVHFLGHVIGHGKLLMDGNKIKAITEWEPPTKVSEMRSFFGLVNYYYRFIQGYSARASPLTDLLKKGKAWEWSEQCQKAFEDLKAAVSQELVLALPDFTRSFEVYIDASDFAIGGVLMQEGHPIAFESRKLNDTERRYTVQEKEMTAIIHCLRVWRHYLLGAHFTIKTDNVATSYFQTQKKLSPKQARWQDFLAEFDYTLEYKPGKTNVVVDALSRKTELATISLAKGTVLERIKEGLEQDPLTRELVKLASDGKTQWFWVEDGLLYTKGRRIYVPKWDNLRRDLIKECHDTKWAGHPGQKCTMSLLETAYFWPHMKDSVELYVKTCLVCQQDKVENRQPVGLLEPLPVPQRPWDSITLDFISALPQSEGYGSIMVVLNFSTSFHPQTDGHTERVNALLECYLRHFVSANQRDWAKLLDVAQFSYNLYRSEATGRSPFELATGQQPLTPHTLTMPLDEGKSPGATKMARSWKENADIARAYLEKARKKMKWADEKRRHREFSVGDLVLVLAKVGKVSYRLDLPSTLKIHPVFHVSMLKPYHADKEDPSRGYSHRAPPVITKSYDKEVETVLTSRTVCKRGVPPRTEYLIKWKGLPESEATWELAEDLWQFEEHLKAYEAMRTTP